MGITVEFYEKVVELLEGFKASDDSFVVANEKFIRLDAENFIAVTSAEGFEASDDSLISAEELGEYLRSKIEIKFPCPVCKEEMTIKSTPYAASPHGECDNDHTYVRTRSYSSLQELSRALQEV